MNLAKRKTIATLAVVFTVVAYVCLSALAQTPFAVRSGAFADGAALPSDAAGPGSCGGRNVLPTLQFSALPEGTKSLALTIFDRDARNGAGFVHFVAYGLDAAAGVLAPDMLAQQGTLGTNGAGEHAYRGPCPPVGAPAHHYVFTLYALDFPERSLAPGLDMSALAAAIVGHERGRATIVGTYARASDAVAVAPSPEASLKPAAPIAKHPGHWDLVGTLPRKRDETGNVVVAGRIYIVGGYADGRVDQPLVDSYDPIARSWSARADMPQGLNHIGIAAIGTTIYTVGGFRGQNRDAVADCYAYDTLTDRWKAIAPLPAKRGSLAVVVLDGKLHALGGRDATSTTEHDVYDPVTDRWTSAAPLPLGRDHLGAVVYAGRIHVLGGRVNDYAHNVDSHDVYDPVTDRWSSAAPLPTARSGGAAGLIAGRIVYIGGERTGAAFTENEAYDPKSGRWTELAPLPEGRHGTGAAVVGDVLYIAGGGPRTGGAFQSDTLFAYSSKP